MTEITVQDWCDIANEVEPQPEGNEWVIVKERVVQKKHANGNCIVLDGFQYKPNSLNQHCALSLSQRISIADYLAAKGVVVVKDNRGIYHSVLWEEIITVIAPPMCYSPKTKVLSIHKNINDCRALAVLALRKDGE